ncbi:MAG: VanZ family protein [Patescibacteria group bacterium]
MQKLKYWLPSIVWMLLIYSFSATPSLRASAIAWQDFYIRKAAHIGEYFILSVLYFYALTKSTSFSRPKRLIYTLILAVIYAFTDEFHQTFVFDRTGKIIDVFIDTLGILTASIALFFWKNQPIAK